MRNTNIPLKLRLLVALGSFLLFTFLAISGIATAQMVASPRAEKGLLDLTEWDFQHNHASLHGEWEFYVGKFIDPDFFYNPAFDEQPMYIEVPGTWKGKQFDDNRLPGDGFGTFRLRVVVGEPTATPIALSLTNVRTSFRAWVDGSLVIKKGLVGTTPDETSPETGFTIAGLGRASGILDIVIHVSNFSFREGGIARVPIIGDENRMLVDAQRSLAIDVFLMASLFVIGLYHFGIWMMRRQDMYTLYFSLFCLVMSARTAVVGKIPLAFVYPFGWELSVKVEYLALYVGLPLLVLFFRALFPAELRGDIASVIVAVHAILSFIVIVTPVRINSYTVIYFEVFAVLVFIYVILGIFRAMRSGRDGARLLMTGTAILFVVAIHDMLFFWRILGNQPLLPLSILALVIAHSLVIAKRFSNEFDKQLVLATENAALLRTVKGQMDEIKRSRRLIMTRGEETRQYVSDLLHGTVQSRLLSARHYLRSSSECLLKDVATGEVVDQSTRDALRMIRKASEQIDQISREDVREISRLLHPLLIRIGLSPATRELLERFSDHLQVGLHVGERLAHLESTDHEKQVSHSISLSMYRIIEELLSNVVKHAHASKVEVTIDLTEDHVLYAMVRDNGCGMDHEKVSRGLGFEMITARTEQWEGTWTVESSIGKGTTILVELPAVLEATTDDTDFISV